jgi:hypothetical protein
MAGEVSEWSWWFGISLNGMEEAEGMICSLLSD